MTVPVFVLRVAAVPSAWLRAVRVCSAVVIACCAVKGVFVGWFVALISSVM